MMLNPLEAETSPPVTHLTTRQNYYFGKLLTADHLQSEQRYLNEKRWLINRYGIGWGVLYGLNVTVDSDHPGTVRIEPGIALDQYGNEIVVGEAQYRNIQTAHEQRDRQGEGESVYYLTLAYDEHDIEPTPIPRNIYDEHGTDYHYNRTLEAFRIDITQTPPEKPRSLWEEQDAIQSGLPRQKHQPITLAFIAFNPNNSSIAIDNVTYRKLAVSNELLHVLIQDLQGAHRDRRRYVPLLANTIKGLAYQDGKITEMENVGREPFRLTSDGDTIWITDRQSPSLIRIDRRTNTVQPDLIELDANNWGIAFDGEAMWVSQPDADSLTRIPVYNGEPWTQQVGAIPSFFTGRPDTVVPVPARPQELFYHQHRLYISHGWEARARVLQVSIVDTQLRSLIGTVTLPAQNGIEPASSILSMASDGDALWVVYKDRRGNAIVRKIQYNAAQQTYVVETPDGIDVMQEPGELVFDGTHLWLTHAAGITRLSINGGEGRLLSARPQLVGLAYCGGEYIWASSVENNQAGLHRINIYTVSREGEVLFNQAANGYTLNDVQFDGAFLYAAGSTSAGGVVHRVLP